jgi:hypothetical protein
MRRVTDRFILQIGLQKHYATLQAIALDEELEDTEDKTVPKFEMIDDVSFSTLKKKKKSSIDHRIYIFSCFFHSAWVTNLPRSRLLYLTHWSTAAISVEQG